MSINPVLTPSEMLWGGDALMELLAMLPDEAYGLSNSECAWADAAWGLGDLRVAWGFPSWSSPAVRSLARLHPGVTFMVPRAEEYKDSEPTAVGPELGPVEAKLRLRRRGVFTRNLEGAVKRAGWWSDLSQACDTPARAWLDSYFSGSGVKADGSAKELHWQDGEKSRSLWVVGVKFSSENGSKELWVSADLLASLSVVRMFRPMTEGLLASLRSRARLWAEDIGMSALDLVRVLPATLALACQPMPDEVLATAAFRGSAAAWSSDVLGALGKGLAKGPSASLTSWWGVLKPCLGGGTRTSPTRAGCALRMPA